MLERRALEELKEILKIKKIKAAKGFNVQSCIEVWILMHLHEIRAELSKRESKPRRWKLYRSSIQMATITNGKGTTCLPFHSRPTIFQYNNYLFIVDSFVIWHRVLVLEMED